MKLLFDTRALQGNIDGISRYSLGLLRALSALRPDWDFLALVGEDSTDPLSGLPVEKIPCNFPRFRPGESSIVSRIIEKTGADLYFNLSMAGPHPDVPTLITVHDLLVLNQPGYFGDSMLWNIVSRIVFRRNIRLSLEHAAAVSVPSDFTMKEVHTAFPGSKGRVFRTGAGQELFPENPLQEERENFLLYVGNARVYKNISRLLVAYSRLKAMNSRFPEMVMVVRKDRAFRNFLREVDDCSARDSIKILSHIPDHRLKQLYRRCMGLVMPSLREGFGFPALEAMAAGAPVVVSSGTALEELTAYAGLKVDPFSVEAIMHGMALLFSSDELRKELSEMSVRRSAEFSWKATAAIIDCRIQEMLP